MNTQADTESAQPLLSEDGDAGRISDSSENLGRDLEHIALSRAVLRKIDRTIIPLLFMTYMLQFMDKIILSSAAVFGLREDNVGSYLSFFVSIQILP